MSSPSPASDADADAASAPARAASSSSRTQIPPHAHAHGHCPLTGADSHAYCPRQPGDSRSPCPALNTLANHGYLPRDGKCITPALLVHALRAAYHLSYPLAAFLTHGGFFLIGQRRRRICLHDLSRHNCIEHDASLVHPDVAYRDEYAPVDIHLHMLDDLMRYSTDGTLMTPDDVARARVAREAEYAIPMDKVHAEIARGEMAIVLQLFNNPDNLAPHAPPRPSLLARVRRLCAFTPEPPPAPVPVPLPGVPNEMLRVWMHEERLPDGWTPYHRVGLLHTMRMATRLRRSMRALEKENRKSARARTRTRTLDGAVAALVPALTIATPERRDADTARAMIVVETGEVGEEPVVEERGLGGAADSPVTVDSPGAVAASPQSTVSSRASSDGLRTPVDVPFAHPAPTPGAGFAKVRESVAVYPVLEEEEGLFERIKERTNTVDSMIAVVA